MTGRPYRHAVLIARLQPCHNGHRAALRRGLELADDLVVVIGSAQRPRSPLGPWTAAEREAMVLACLDPGERRRVRCVHQWDYLYNEALWVGAILGRVADAWTDLGAACPGAAGPVALLGRAGEDEQDWVRSFPQWTFEPVPPEPVLDAGAIRAGYLAGAAGAGSGWAASVPPEVQALLARWEGSPEHGAVAEEWRQLAAYRARWSAVPFPVVFTTVDALVVRSGHALLVRRGHHPGRGLLALPGGFLDAAGDRSLRAGALRELREETGIQVPDAELARAIVAERAFDHPERSLRGRTITHAVCIDLGPGPLPGVRGADDAQEALWLPLADLRRRPGDLFDDHFDIIVNLTGRI